MIFLSETWSTDDVTDTEVKIPEHILFRSERKGRARGGAASYLKSNMYHKHVVSYSNGVVKFVMTKIRRLKSLAIALYRPPDTYNSEWKSAIDALKNDIIMAQSNGDF